MIVDEVEVVEHDQLFPPKLCGRSLEVGWSVANVLETDAIPM